MVIIGLGGLKGVGKDTVAQYLVDIYGFKKASLADPIKKLLNERFGWTMSHWDDRAWKECPEPDCGVNPIPITECDQRTQYFSPRSWAQWLGTEVGRTIAGQDVWVNMLLDELAKEPPESRFVISDCRFENEVHNISDQGGFSICLVDPERTETPEHTSEAINPEWYDYEVTARRGDIDGTFYDIECIMALEGIPPIVTH